MHAVISEWLGMKIVFQVGSFVTSFGSTTLISESTLSENRKKVRSYLIVSETQIIIGLSRFQKNLKDYENAKISRPRVNKRLHGQTLLSKQEERKFMHLILL